MLAGHGSQTAGVASTIGEVRYREWIAREWFRRPAWTELSAAVVARSLGIAWDTLARRQPAAVS